MTANKATGLWFPNVQFNAQSGLRLFCFPYAGGSNLIYRSWQSSLPAQVEVCPVQLPCRGNCLGERPFTDLPLLIEAIKPATRLHLENPFAFLGHSMGAIITYELARLLRRTSGYQPIRLFATRCVAPHCEREEAPSYNLPEPEFLEELRSMNGRPQEVLEHPELMQMIMPLLRADFELIETYAYSPGELLDCPITALGGVQDPEVSR